MERYLLVAVSGGLHDAPLAVDGWVSAAAAAASALGLELQ